MEKRQCPLNCEILPRSDASAEELKRLGVALSDWLNTYLDEVGESGLDVEVWLDMDGIDSLLAGELPAPFAIRCGVPGMAAAEFAEAVAVARSRYSLLRRLLPMPSSRGVTFGLSLDEEVSEEVITRLRHALPMDLVSVVRINGRESETLT